MEIRSLYSSKKDKVADGKIYFAIKEVSDHKNYLRETFQLSSEETNAVLEFIDKYQILKLPTDNDIAGWTNGLDGEIFQVESFTKGNFRYQSYWSPQLQNIVESKIVTEFFNDLYSVTNVESKFKNFIAKNTFTCYTYYGDSYSVCKIYTRKELRKIRRNQKRIRSDN